LFRENTCHHIKKSFKKEEGKRGKKKGSKNCPVIFILFTVAPDTVDPKIDSPKLSIRKRRNESKRED
jgi:hypothetical protein